MASLSRKIQLQQFSWQVLEDLAFCSTRWPRLAELAAQVLVERQSAAPALPVDAAIEALIHHVFVSGERGNLPLQITATEANSAEEVAKFELTLSLK